MKNLILIFLLVFTGGVFASTTRTIDADTITSSDKSKTYTMPSVTGTLSINGQTPIAAQFTRDSYAGNGSTTAFTLTNTPPSASQVEIFIDGILQIQTTDYSISGTTLTFVTAPALGQDIKAIYSRF